jgi:hypothetical protein
MVRHFAISRKLVRTTAPAEAAELRAVASSPPATHRARETPSLAAEVLRLQRLVGNARVGSLLRNRELAVPPRRSCDGVLRAALRRTTFENTIQRQAGEGQAVNYCETNRKKRARPEEDSRCIDDKLHLTAEFWGDHKKPGSRLDFAFHNDPPLEESFKKPAEPVEPMKAFPTGAQDSGSTGRKEGRGTCR